jgi:hypothetical protein
MAIGLVKESSVARDSADQGLGGIVDGRWCGKCAARPSEGIPNGGTHVLAVCAALGQLDYFATLALQQHGQQSALRKGRRHDFPFFLSKRWTIFAGIPFIPCGRVANRPKILNKNRVTNLGQLLPGLTLYKAAIL